LNNAAACVDPATAAGFFSVGTCVASSTSRRRHRLAGGSAISARSRHLAA
jgi:hypothetical protein